MNELDLLKKCTFGNCRKPGKYVIPGIGGEYSQILCRNHFHLKKNSNSIKKKK